MVYTLALGASAFGHGGSSPLLGTTMNKKIYKILVIIIGFLVCLLLWYFLIQKSDKSSDKSIALAENAIEELSVAIQNKDIERAKELIGDAWGRQEPMIQYSQIDESTRVAIVDGFKDIHFVFSSNEEGQRDFHEFSSTVTYKGKTTPMQVRVYYHYSDNGEFIVDEIDM